MPNGRGMINDLEFEQQIKDFTPAERFLAREIYDIKKQCAVCNVSGYTKHRIINMSGIIIALATALAALIKALHLGG